MKDITICVILMVVAVVLSSFAYWVMKHIDAQKAKAQDALQALADRLRYVKEVMQSHPDDYVSQKSYQRSLTSFVELSHMMYRKSHVVTFEQHLFIEEKANDVFVDLEPLVLMGETKGELV